MPDDRRFLIITSQWRGWPWIRQTVESIEAQTYPNYDVCLVDDASGIPELTAYIEEKCDEHRWNRILRERQQKMLRNQVDAIRLMDPQPEDVIVFLDGDGDRFAHPGVLDRLVEAYADGSLVVYSNYQPEPASPGSIQSRPHPPEVIAANSYRKFTRTHGHHWNHLRTISARTFLAMDDSDFKDDRGRWFPSAPDSAIMFPALELAGGRVKHLPEILLIYRADHELSDWKQQPRQIDADHDVILRRRPKTPLPA